MQWIYDSWTVPISFPFFGLEINPPKGIEIFGFNLHFYGVIIAVGLILAVLYGWKRSKEFGIKSDDITDGVLWIAPVAIICARLFYCLFTWEENGFNEDPLRILDINKGGLAIFGGVIGAALGVVVFSYIKKIKVPALLDLVALGFLIGQALGRWGNFFNREAFGAETDFFLKMGLPMAADRYLLNTTLYYHPTFLYESVWNAAGFVLLHFLSKRRKYDGQIALGYMAWYGLGRTLIEGLRTDSLYIWEHLRVNQLIAATICAVGVIMLLIMAFRYHAPEKLFVNQVAAREAEEALAKESEEDAGESEEELEEDTVAETTEETEE